MAQIIQLQSRARATRRTAPAVKSAQILFFTGVRYMRIEDYSPTLNDSPERCDGGGKKRKRRARA